MNQGREPGVEVYTIAEVAERLRCSYHTVWRGIQTGRIKACTYMAGRVPAAEVGRLLRGES
jgi:excisionase family DNA binding protein